MQGTPPTSDSIQRRRRRWGRKQTPEAEGAAYIAVASFPQAGTADRFQPPSLRPIEVKKSRRSASAGAKEGSNREKEDAAPPRLKLRPWRTLDKVLLVVEVVGALVVAWLVWQYVYTVYIDTAPRRVTPARTATALVVLPGAQSPTPRATPSPTRFVEIAPPLEGTPGGGEGVGVGGPLGGSISTPTATPTATIDPQALLPTRLRIPAMSLDSPVHEVTVNMGEWQVSPMDIGHHYGTGNPGEIGNVVLAGHRDINSALFRELDRLGPGDEVFVSNKLGEYRYTVTESYIVSPNQTEVMDPTDDKRVTMITCTPIGLATQRLIVVAVMD